LLEHLYDQPKNPIRVVILGASGFVGSHLLLTLQRKQISCLGLSSREIDFAEEGADQKLAEVLLPTDSIIVLAVCEPNKNMSINAFIRNIQMANNIGLAIQRIKCQQIVYFSSDAVYSFENKVIAENTLPSPSNLYGAMHLSREIIFRDLISRTQLTIIRPTQIYGVAARHNAYGPVSLCRSVLQENKVRLVGFGEEKRDFIPVEDVIQLTLLILQHGSYGVINFATGSSVCYADLADKISALLERSLTVELADRKNVIFHRQFEISNLKKAFPSFTFTTLEEGLRELLKHPV
jgi:UDP-glucose 4-epimerase